MTDTSTDVTEIRKGHDMDVDKLTSYLMKEIPGFSGPIGIKQFGFGQSNPTFLLTDSNGQQYVLRKQPPGKLSNKTAHQVAREYTIMKALQGVIPVPEVHVLCQDPSILGVDFFVMDFGCTHLRKRDEHQLGTCDGMEQSKICLCFLVLCVRHMNIIFKRALVKLFPENGKSTAGAKTPRSMINCSVSSPAGSSFVVASYRHIKQYV